MDFCWLKLPTIPTKIGKASFLKVKDSSDDLSQFGTVTIFLTLKI